MTQPSLETLEPRARRRLMQRALLRALLSATALVLLYYLLPMDRAVDGLTVTLYLVGLLAFAGLISWQVRSILRSDYPGLRAIDALTTAIPLFLLLFASAYFLMAQAQTGAFSEPLTRTDALYFTITVFATVGFGDITPKSETARVLTTVQMIADLFVFGVLIRVVFGAVRVRRAGRSSRPASPTYPRRPSNGRHSSSRE